MVKLPIIKKKITSLHSGHMFLVWNPNQTEYSTNPIGNIVSFTTRCTLCSERSCDRKVTAKVTETLEMSGLNGMITLNRIAIFLISNTTYYNSYIIDKQGAYLQMRHVRFQWEAAKQCGFTEMHVKNPSVTISSLGAGLGYKPAYSQFLCTLQLFTS